MSERAPEPNEYERERLAWRPGQIVILPTSAESEDDDADQ